MHKCKNNASVEVDCPPLRRDNTSLSSYLKNTVETAEKYHMHSAITRKTSIK